MSKPWQFIANQFENSTRNNYKKAVKLSIYHDAALKSKKDAQPLLIPVYERYKPVHDFLISKYNGWKSAGGSQEGETLNVEQMLELAYSNMQRWDITIQAAGTVFLKGTPNYLAIFMNGRSSFITGSIDSRINAYDTLAKNMMPFALLATVMAEVVATYDILDEAREKQLGAKGDLKTGSGNVEIARIEAMTMQYRNLGFAMDAFYDQPMYIESMFDLQTLRENRQTLFVGTLSPAENKAIVVHTFLADEELRLKNNGSAIIFFYLGKMANGIDSEPVKVNPNDEVVAIASEFGPLDFSVHRFLTAVNQSPAVVTQFEVEIQ